MVKQKTKHVPENCIGLIISFKSKEARDRFIETDVYKTLIGTVSAEAIKNKAKFDLFWNP
jgi:hypothetical protein